MKFIGQYIQHFIARFRNDVYLEDIDTGTIASGGNLGLDSNNKIVKADVPADGDITSVKFTSSVGTHTESSGDAEFILAGSNGLTFTNVNETFTVTASNASTSIKGVASFNSENFIVSSGAVNLAPTISIGNVTVDDKIQHDGDTDTFIHFGNGGDDTITLTTGNVEKLYITNSNTVFNETGSDIDFRVEASGEANALFVQGSDGNVGIGTSSPSEKLEVDGNISIGDNDQIKFGANNDLKIYHSSSLSRNIIDNDVGDLYINQNANDKDIIFRCDDGSGGTETYFFLDGSNGWTTFPDNKKAAFGTGNDLQIYHDSSNSYLRNTNGNLYIKNELDDGDIIFQSDDGSGGVETYFFLDGSLSSGNPFTVFPDDSRLAIGDDADMIIYHNGNSSFITQKGTGDLYITNSTNDKDIIFQSDDGAGGLANYFRIDGSQAAHDGSASTALYTTWIDNSRIALGTDRDLHLHHTGSHSKITNYTGNLEIINNTDDGNIIFKSDDGSGSTAIYFYLDGGNENVRFEKDIFLLDDVKLRIGSDTDLEIYNDGTDSYLHVDSGDLIIEQTADDKDIIFKSDDGSGGVTEYFRVDGGDERVVFSKEARLNDSVSLKLGSSGDLQMYHDGSNSYMRQISSGNLYIDQLVDDSDIVLRSDDGSGGLATYLQIDGSAEQTRFYKDTRHTDGIKANFGNSDDLQIYHDGNHSYIVDAGTGDLLNYFSNEWKVIKYGSSETCIEATSDGSVDLYYDNSKKLETTSTGVDVTGNIASTGRVISKQYQAYSANFLDDLGTDKHYLPIVDSPNEQTIVYRHEAAMTAPCDGRIASVTIRFENLNTHSGDANVTVGVESRVAGVSYAGTWTVEETETVAIPDTADHDTVHFQFANAKHFDSAELFAVSIQSDTDITGTNERFWVTVVVEWDWSTYLGTEGTSTIYSSTP